LHLNFVPADQEETCHDCGEAILPDSLMLLYTIREPSPLDETETNGLYELKSFAASLLSSAQPKVISEEQWSSTVRFRFRSTRVVLCEVCGKLLIESQDHPIDKKSNTDSV
jgi:ribosomal protein S27E